MLSKKKKKKNLISRGCTLYDSTYIAISKKQSHNDGEDTSDCWSLSLVESMTIKR